MDPATIGSALPVEHQQMIRDMAEVRKSMAMRCLRSAAICLLRRQHPFFPIQDSAVPDPYDCTLGRCRAS